MAPTLVDRVVAALRREGTATASVIARAIGAPVPSVNAACHRAASEGKLVRDGYVWRLAKPTPVHAIDCDMDEDCTCGAEEGQ